jgi:hypothetical protein
VRWFASGPYAARQRDGRVGPNPAHVVHAKEVGTVLTACGIQASSWHRFWGVSFLQDIGLRRCPSCLEEVLATTSSRRSTV